MIRKVNKKSVLSICLTISTPSSTVEVKGEEERQRTALVYIIVVVGAFAVIVAITCALRYKYFRKERSPRPAGLCPAYRFLKDLLSFFT